MTALRSVKKDDDKMVDNIKKHKGLKFGIVAVLLLCGVPREEIVADYVLSAQCLRGRLGEVHRRFPQLDMAIVTPCEWYMQQFLSLFLARYGGAEEYLRSRGMSEGQISRLRGKLL